MDFWIKIWNQWFCQENAFYMYICRNQTPTPWKIVPQIWISNQTLKSMILPGERILHVNMQKPNPYPLENSSSNMDVEFKSWKQWILPGKRILHVNMQKPNPYPLENSPQIWILRFKIWKQWILPGNRILHVNMQKPNPHPLENSPPNMDFGLKSEISDFARKTHFTCTYAETIPPPEK